VGLAWPVLRSSVLLNGLVQAPGSTTLCYAGLWRSATSMKQVQASTYLVRYSIGLLQCKAVLFTLRRKTSAVQNSIRNTQRLNSHS